MATQKRTLYILNESKCTNLKGNWSVNHHFCAVINSYSIVQIWNYLHVFQSALQEPHLLIFKTVSPQETAHPSWDSKHKRTRTPKPQTSSSPIQDPYDPQATGVQHMAEEQHQLPIQCTQFLNVS